MFIYEYVGLLSLAESETTIFSSGISSFWGFCLCFSFHFVQKNNLLFSYLFISLLIRTNLLPKTKTTSGNNLETLSNRLILESLPGGDNYFAQKQHFCHSSFYASNFFHAATLMKRIIVCLSQSLFHPNPNSFSRPPLVVTAHIWAARECNESYRYIFCHSHSWNCFTSRYLFLLAP